MWKRFDIEKGKVQHFYRLHQLPEMYSYDTIAVILNVPKFYTIHLLTIKNIIYRSENLIGNVFFMLLGVFLQLNYSHHYL
jgi:hypothetical protein